MTKLTIATRKSPLALWQAEYVKNELVKHHPQLDVSLLKMSTQGDKILDTPLALIGGKGLFVKELERALLDGDADIAVHSMKDVPVEFPEGLVLTTICPREDPDDAFISNHYTHFDQLPQGAVVGTSSLRRQTQLLHARPDLIIKDCRGNVGTRLGKLDNGEFDAIILAAAGLKRLGLQSRISHSLDHQLSLPAAGQGAVGIEARDVQAIAALLAPLNHHPTQQRVLAERALNQTLGGGCQVPIAAHATLQHNTLTLLGRVISMDGKTLLKASCSGPAEDYQAIGQELARQLLEQGADDILKLLLQDNN